MKLFNLIAWISAGMGFLFVLLGLIQVLVAVIRPMFGILPGDYRLFGDTEVVNFFIASTNFFIITIVMYVLHYKNQLNKD